MICPTCNTYRLEFRNDGMSAACSACARIFGAGELLAEMQRTLDLKRARLVAGSSSRVANRSGEDQASGAARIPDLPGGPAGSGGNARGRSRPAGPKDSCQIRGPDLTD